MPETNGDVVAETMKRIKPDTRILMFSGLAEVPEQARRNVDAFLQKGEAPAVVLNKIRELLDLPTKAA
jgi:hypothetical protein